MGIEPKAEDTAGVGGDKAVAPFHILAKPIGPMCNLDCTYCFYLEKEVLYPRTSKWAMPDDVLEEYVRQYIEHQKTDVIHFAWQGGEPTLLGVEFFRRVVELQAKYAGSKRIENAIQTNGTLLNDEWGAFLREQKFLVGISIDGPRELHDIYRVDKGNQPTFDKVMRGIDLLKRHEVEFNTLTTVHAGNVEYPLMVYEFLRRIGSGFMQFIPIVERAAEQVAKDGLVLIAPSFKDVAAVTPWSVDPVLYGRFLCDIFDQWVVRDVGRVFVQLFDVALESWVGVPASLCIFRPTCGSAMAVEHNGDVYSCDHFVYEENRLGNVMEKGLAAMATSLQQHEFGQSKQTELPQYCRQCEVRFACNGECPKHRFTMTPDGEAGLNYLCPAYKLFFKHIDAPMRFMARELAHQRSPANVMAWMRGMKTVSPTRRVGRNEMCPCGSGVKYKRCCGQAPQAVRQSN